MREFHIHIDAAEISRAFGRYLIHDLGFWCSDFCGHPDGIEHYEPRSHLTYKTIKTADYKRVFRCVEAYAEHNGGLIGYAEGEYIASDDNIRAKPYDPSVLPPFRFQPQFLPASEFRETELHITLSRDRSDPRLMANLLSMGFFCAYLPKSYGVAAIFTAQGTRPLIAQILDHTLGYLQRAGGAVACSIKEERIAHWWLSEPNIPRPPVIKTVEWFT